MMYYILYYHLYFYGRHAGQEFRNKGYFYDISSITGTQGHCYEYGTHMASLYCYYNNNLYTICACVPF